MSRYRHLAAALLLFAPAASAHDMWIVPPESPAAGEVVEVRLHVGHAGSATPVRRDSRRIVRFTASGPEGETPVPGLEGARVAGVFRPQVPGLWAVAYESTASYSELPGPRFTAYLEEEGLDQALALRRRRGEEDRPGRELYSRSLKSLVAVGEAGDGDDRVGLPLELVAETLPAAGAPLRLRLYLHGEPVSGARVDVRRLDREAPAVGGRTDADGRVGFTLGQGSWLAATVHIEPAASEQADWRSIFSSLTFVVADPPSSTATPAAGFSPAVAER